MPTTAPVFVLLADEHDGTALVACPDVVTAESVAAAAAYPDGEVSARLVQGSAITDTDAAIRILRGGGGIDELEDLADAPVTLAIGD
jgi:hypothetical protein